MSSIAGTPKTTFPGTSNLLRAINNNSRISDQHKTGLRISRGAVDLEVTERPGTAAAGTYSKLRNKVSMASIRTS